VRDWVQRRALLLLLGALGVSIGGLGVVAPASAASVANQYIAYQTGITGGEPSIGYDVARNAAIYGQVNVSRLTWDDTKPGSPMTAVDITPPGITSLDPITIVDPYTNRTFTSQLLGACSDLYYSDNAGASFTHSVLGCAVGAVEDHQTVGAGPVHAPLPGILYPDAVYYCAQNGYSESCGVSLNGGATFGAAVPITNTPGFNDLNDSNLTFKAEGGACSGLTGHLKVGPDGTAYVPINGCGGTFSFNNLTNQEYVGGQPSLAVSEDNGTTWPTIRRVIKPGVDNQNESDPSLGIAKADGTLYFGWQNGHNPSDIKNGDESQAMISVSHDRGLTWTTPVDVSTPLGLHNVQFPEVVAGDPDRAAFAFLGTKGTGDDQVNAYPNPGQPRDWHLYISTTYDGGKTYTTVDTTPNKPVQRGCIDLQGIAPGSPRTDTCTQRNLLDFNDITVDGTGRVIAAYGDGCTGKCATDPKAASSGSVDMAMRQACGRGLYAKFDPGFTANCPLVTAAGPGDLPNTLPPTAAGGPYVGLAALGISTALGAAAFIVSRRRRRAAA
jgi:hypothetical protein